MRETEVAVEFRPSERTAYVLRGTRLVEAAAEVGMVLDQPCGGAGVCGKCRVRFEGDPCPPTAVEAARLSAAELAQGYRLACQATVCGPATIEIPDASLLAAGHQILAHSDWPANVTIDSEIGKQYIELAVPRRGDDASDAVRLARAVGPIKMDLHATRLLPERLRQTGFRGTVVTVGNRLIDFEPGNTEAESHAVAVDLGTTTLVATLLDAATGKELAIASRLNPQTRFGDDVLARILHATNTRDGLVDLARSATEAMDEMIGQLTTAARTRRDRVYEVAISGNTTMQQLLCRIDPQALGSLPFVPGMGPGLTLDASEIGLGIHPRGQAYVMPVIGGFVGGDTVAGILASGMMESTGPTLLVDIGTNGEIVLWANGRLTAASTAAGPAFEGARIMHGMRGSTGAIEKVVMDEQMRVNVIGGVPPVGICGSGLIDAAAELLRQGLLTPQGRLLGPGELPSGLPPQLAQRVTQYEGKPAIILATAEETGTDRPVVLTQRDLRELQLATGAIRAGISILLEQAGLTPERLDSVLIAGGFGNFIRRSNAQRIGLMPHCVERHRIRYLGNTSLAGAKMVALSRHCRQQAEQIALVTEHVDLSTSVAFQTAFAESMIFPE
ncbi:MAG: ASKHA domain-containing protein [Patescibacteria group bacterium]|nr:ASKHA domain-containing protein [Patescibacteria group bacterium]